MNYAFANTHLVSVCVCTTDEQWEKERQRHSKKKPILVCVCVWVLNARMVLLVFNDSNKEHKHFVHIHLCTNTHSHLSTCHLLCSLTGAKPPNRLVDSQLTERFIETVENEPTHIYRCFWCLNTFIHIFLSFCLIYSLPFFSPLLLCFSPQCPLFLHHSCSSLLLLDLLHKLQLYIRLYSRPGKTEGVRERGRK